jgi:enamine deaminase RidA (YjgF/YER057c/UK114 family)
VVGKVQLLNPDGLIKNPAFSQAAVVSGPVKTVYIGAQNSVDGKNGTIVGEGDIAAQTEQTLRNIDACLEAAGADRNHLVSWDIYVKEGVDLRPAFEVGMRWLGTREAPPLNNVLFVSSFPRPEFLISITAVAVVPE